METSTRHGEPAFGALVKEVVDGLGKLFAGHLKLARVELAADARGYARRLGLLALASSLLAVGYALMCVAAALALTPYIGAPFGFLAIGAAHVLCAGIGVGALLGRTASAPLAQTLSELDHTVTALAAAAPERLGSNGVA
jgi:uncharacterized membrane protein YqjE